MLKVITVTTDLEATKPLINSLEKNGWQWHAIETTWRGFGTKIIETYNYLKEHPEVDEFIFCDAFDVLVLGGPQEFKEKLGAYNLLMICSAERGCWPVPSLNSQYKFKEEGGFNYLNSGLYYAPSEVFIKLFEQTPPDFESDDQLYLTEQYLFHADKHPIVLDQKQVFFNSHSFIAEGDYTYENNRVQILGNQPLFIHSNGRTIDPKLDELLATL